MYYNCIFIAYYFVQLSRSGHDPGFRAPVFCTWPFAVFYACVLYFQQGCHHQPGHYGLKAALVPYILFWAIRHVSMRSEIKPFIGFGASVIFGAMVIACAFWVSLSLKLPGQPLSDFILPCSLSTVLLGFMIMVTRTRAVTQVLGYLILENGIFLFGFSLSDVMPALIEMGILLDIFVAVFIMAIVVNHINEEFEKAGETF